MSDPTKDEIRRVMSANGKKGGPLGGKARAAKLSKRKRVAIAKKAAAARWAKHAQSSPPLGSEADTRAASGPSDGHGKDNPNAVDA